MAKKEKLKLTEVGEKDFIVQSPERFYEWVNSKVRLEVYHGEWVMDPRKFSSGLFYGTHWSSDELIAIAEKLKELNK